MGMEVYMRNLGRIPSSQPFALEKVVWYLSALAVDIRLVR